LSRRRAPSRLSSLRCGKLQSFFSGAIAPNTFLREVPPTIAVSSSAGASASADADLSSANSSPPGPLQPKHRAADLGPQGPRPPHPGHISSWPKREGSRVAAGAARIEQPGRSVVPPAPLCPIRFDSPFWASTIPLAWAGGRALLGSNPSAVPGAETEWGGIVPPSSIRDRHQSAKSPPLPSRSLSPASPLLSSLPPRRPGIRRRSSACSACAR